MRIVICALLAVAACGDNSIPTVVIGGTVEGLAGNGLVLRDHRGDELAISAAGTFVFPEAVAYGEMYAVTVAAQPSNPKQTCTVSAGTGRVEVDAPIANIRVTCETSRLTVSGTVTGLSGSGLVLANNGSDELAISADGSFTFETPVESGAAFAVTIASQPTDPSQTCTVSGATGTVGNGPVTTVVVDCIVDRFTIGGTISGLAGTVVLQNQGGDDIAVASNGSFAFPTTVASGASYVVTVSAQPSVPSQTCVVTSGAGTVTSADITSVEVDCTTNTFTIGGVVAGLSGTGLVLENHGGDSEAISGDGSFTFSTPIASGTTFDVTVKAQPTGPSQTCTVTGGTGTVGGGDVTSVMVNCTTDQFTVGGTISGLAGTVVLQNNGGDDLTVTANGSYGFATPIESGASYEVSVGTQPASPSQTCTVEAGTGTGTVTSSHVTSVVVTCTTNRYTIGGTLTGLAAGNTLVLRNNGADDLTLAGDGEFTFDADVPSGETYTVTVVANPVAPVSQTCSVTRGTATVGGSNVTNISVTCTTNEFTIGGSVTGLTSSGLVLTNNDGDDLPISADGSFTFTTPIASGATYAVAVKTNPTGLYCWVKNRSGTVENSSVTNVAVTCAICNGNVLVLTDPDSTHASAVATALDAAGLNPTVVVGGITSYAGTPAATEFGAVLLLVGNAWGQDMPLSGQQAIVDAYNGGSTSILYTEWSAYNATVGIWNTLKGPEIMQRIGGGAPTENSSWQRTTEHVVWTGLPTSFTASVYLGMNLGAVINGGTQIATIDGEPGLAVKDGPARVVQLGHSANFHSDTSSVIWTADPNLELMFTNAALWAARCY